MGDRFIFTIVCPKCKHEEPEVYYAPTCGFTKCKCNKCGEVIDLAKYTGISYEDCSSRELNRSICEKIKR